MVQSIGRLISVLALFAVGLAAGPAAAAQTNSQQRIVERARLALDSFLDDPTFSQMPVYVQNAYAVLIVPDLLKAGFFVGAEHGIGVLLVRDPSTGAWGKPAFYDLYGGSFGLQFGGLSSDVVFTIMNEGAVDRLLAHGIKLGADLGVAAGRMGAGVGAATTTHLGEDIYTFAKGSGLFGGFWLDGSWLRAKDDWNTAYYGRPIPAREIVRDHQVVASAEVAALHQSLTRF